MANKRWSDADIPVLEGKVFLITGANAGLGLQSTCFLANKGAEIVMAVRNVEKAKKAAAQPSQSARDRQLSWQLWEVSEHLTQIRFL